MWLLKQILIQLIIFQICICTVLTVVRPNKRSTVAGGRLSRLSSSIDYNVNILTKLNSNYVFPLVIGQNEKVGLWLLTRQPAITNPGSSVTEALYDPRSLPRNLTVTDDYACLPSEKTCNQLSLRNFDLSDIGVYTFRFDSADYLTMKSFTFNVSAYFEPISISCANLTNESVCDYNKNTQTLSVIANAPVSITCGIPVVQNAIYPISAQFNFISELYGEECMGDTNVTPLNSNLSTLSNPNNSKYNVLLNKLSKNCTRTFTKQDLSKSYSCQLNPLVSSSQPASYEQTKTYESLDIKLDVQYGPDPTTPLNPIPQSSFGLFNKTQMVGDDKVGQKFICPYIGNPRPLYYWRVVSANTNGTEETSKLRTLITSDEFMLSDTQEFPIPSDLQVGTYSFECKAKVEGLIGQFSQTIRFNLNMIPQPPIPQRKAKFNPDSLFMKSQNSDINIGAIIGGVIGGIVLLALITIVVIAAIRISRNNNPKNDIEKAKEIDIDMTDHHNSDLNNRKADMLQQQQQQQVKQQLGNKVIAGLMPNSTAQAYASIAHAAAAAAQSNQNRNNIINNNSNSNVNTSGGNVVANTMGYQSNDQFNQSSSTHTGSSNNLLGTTGNGGNGNGSLLTQHNNIHTKSQSSYNNPGFFESASYSNQNPLESPPPYDAALHQPLKKSDSPPIQQQQLRFNQQQQLMNQQQQQQMQHKAEYMGSNTRLISASNTPVQTQRPISHTSQSYTCNNQAQNLSLHSSTPNNQISASMQHLQYQQQALQQNNASNQLQYTSVHNIENRARSRNPLNGGPPSDMDNNMQQQQQQQCYTTMAAQLSSNPIDV